MQSTQVVLFDIFRQRNLPKGSLLWKKEELPCMQSLLLYRTAPAAKTGLQASSRWKMGSARSRWAINHRPLHPFPRIERIVLLFLTRNCRSACRLFSLQRTFCLNSGFQRHQMLRLLPPLSLYAAFHSRCRFRSRLKRCDGPPFFLLLLPRPSAAIRWCKHRAGSGFLIRLFISFQT